MKVFITGVSEGIGRELVKNLTRAGHDVWGIARRKELLTELQFEIGDKFLFSVCDVTDERAVTDTIRQMREKHFLPDVAVLSAVIFGNDLHPNYRHDVFQNAFAVNVFGALTWVDKLLPELITRGSGRFIAMSSTSAFRPNAESASLPASKSALALAFRSLHFRYHNAGINFKTIYLGPVATRTMQKWTADSGKPNRFFVSTPEAAARFVEKVVYDTSAKTEYWFPFFITLLFRLTLFLPDRLFLFISKIVGK
ncbi:MAG: SDR family oxidoreductase [Candidatus Harrisonbacteria bacterium]|nr:SDR family oxidoreductase [Candidatus Harrisonbacteria bacterium]